MLQMDEKGYEWFRALREELAWLKENHPEKRALIGVAESSVNVIRQAGATESAATRCELLDDLSNGQ